MRLLQDVKDLVSKKSEVALATFYMENMLIKKAIPTFLKPEAFRTGMVDRNICRENAQVQMGESPGLLSLP